MTYLGMIRVRGMIGILRRLGQLGHVYVVGGALGVAGVDVGAWLAVGLLDEVVLSFYFLTRFLEEQRMRGRYAYG